MMIMTRFLIIAALLGVLPAAQASIQVGFSPEGSARKLVLSTIDGAQRSIDMMAYSFQAKDIVDALIRAQKRGVKVRAVIDKRRNQGEVSLKAIARARENGIDVRIDGHYHIQHDKVMIVDGNTLETGSFNFAKSAETENSENVLVIRDEPEVIRQYQAHFDSRWALGKPQ
ncbi:TPA: phospholipase D family protein [Kluyvera ascorbata]|nr:phospholipase D family protein [Kluyvera ascorbata]